MTQMTWRRGGPSFLRSVEDPRYTVAGYRTGAGFDYSAWYRADKDTPALLIQSGCVTSAEAQGAADRHRQGADKP